MDISTTVAPRSDQQNYDDYLTGPKTVTVSEVKAGTAEQPVEIHLVEFPGRPYKPSKSMRRVLVAAWGSEASVYKGRRLTLYGDPDVLFAGQPVGGIKISHLSHITSPMRIALTQTRGKRAPFTVEPLGGEEGPVDESGRDWLAELELAIPEGRDAVLALGKAARAANAGVGVLNVMTRAYNQFPKEQQ